MTRRPSTRSFAPWLIALLIWVVARIGCAVYVEQDANRRAVGEARVTVSDRSETVMEPLDVAPPQIERWRDIAGVAYDERFIDEFSYADADRRVTIDYEREAGTLRGSVHARGLKPGFAYQLKLVGLEPLRGPRTEDNTSDARAWSSWQLGRAGRWWCEHCQWNVLDSELADHVGRGHAVTGYLLFDWFVTDAAGNADHRFALDSSLHVL